MHIGNEKEITNFDFKGYLRNIPKEIIEKLSMSYIWYNLLFSWALYYISRQKSIAYIAIITAEMN